MTQEEFVRLSERQVKWLNGSDKEIAREAWRGGYIYLLNKINELYNIGDFDYDFFDHLESLLDQNLNELK